MRLQLASESRRVLRVLDAHQVGIGHVIRVIDLGVQFQQPRTVARGGSLVGGHEEPQASGRMLAGLPRPGFIPPIEFWIVGAVVQHQRFLIARVDAFHAFPEPAVKRGLTRLLGLELGAHGLEFLPKPVLFSGIGFGGGLAERRLHPSYPPHRRILSPRLQRRQRQRSNIGRSQLDLDPHAVQCGAKRRDDSTNKG